jgi:ADP-ribosylglycohydrolase
VENAAYSCEVTHAHPEAVAGAVAVALGAAWAWRLRDADERQNRQEFLARILPDVPPSEVRERLTIAHDLPEQTMVEAAAELLGNGYDVTAQDTVPFALWCAGQHLDNYEEALWLTVSGLGDRDTTCAMVGGIVALSAGADSIPALWKVSREPLPRWPFQETSEI